MFKNVKMMRTRHVQMIDEEESSERHQKEEFSKTMDETKRAVMKYLAGDVYRTVCAMTTVCCNEVCTSGRTFGFRATYVFLTSTHMVLSVYLADIGCSGIIRTLQRTQCTFASNLCMMF